MLARPVSGSAGSRSGTVYSRKSEKYKIHSFISPVSHAGSLLSIGMCGIERSGSGIAGQLGTKQSVQQYLAWRALHGR